MFMYLPFLIGFLTVMSFLLDHKKLGYILWGILLIVTVIWFKYHSTSSLNLSF
ncbi:MAG: DUF5993 family protein [Candidatus Dasytiphilus stammeri]